VTRVRSILAQRHRTFSRLSALLLPALLLPALLLAAFFVQGCSTSDSRADEPTDATATQDGSAKSADPKGSDGPTKAEGKGSSKETSAAEEDEAVPVEVTELGLGSIESVLRFSTNLEAEREVEVFAEAARRVEELRVEEGDEVEKGDLLLRLQDDEQRTTLAKAKTEYDKAKREYDRQKKLFSESLISEQAMNDATYEIERLALSVEEAERALSYTEVRAPISGTITERLVNVGDYVTPNQQLFSMVDFDSIVARVFVPEKELPRLKKGLTARVSSPALGEARFGGRVDRISPVVDPRSGTVKVTVDLPRSPGLRPGMYVDVELVTSLHKDALLLPKRALVYDNDQIFAFRLEKDEADGSEEGDEGVDRLKARRLLVRPVLEDKRFIEVTGGPFRPGDAVVIAGQAGLKDGTVVRRVDRVEADGTAAQGEGRTDEAAQAPAAAEADE
jgi:membrane fusion protein (multidrug efflux system)